MGTVAIEDTIRRVTDRLRTITRRRLAEYDDIRATGATHPQPLEVEVTIVVSTT